jgi:hypothetical protein
MSPPRTLFENYFAEETWVDTDDDPSFRQEFYPSEEGRMISTGDRILVVIYLWNGSARFEVRQPGGKWLNITGTLWSIPNCSPIGFGNIRYPDGFGGRGVIQAGQEKRVDLVVWGPAACDMRLRCHHESPQDTPGQSLIKIKTRIGPGVDYTSYEQWL